VGYQARCHRRERGSTRQQGGVQPQSEALFIARPDLWVEHRGVHATKSALGPFSFQTGVQLQTGVLTDMVLLRINSAMQRTRQEARDALQQLLPPTKIMHDDPNWGARSCQFFVVAHALQQVNYPNPPRGMDLRLRSKTWLLGNYALVSPFLTDISQEELQVGCRNYTWSGPNMMQGDQYSHVHEYRFLLQHQCRPGLSSGYPTSPWWRVGTI